MRHEDIAEKAAKAGFTLIEIIIAISIVGIMAAVAVPNINKYLKNARINAARQLIDTAKNATIQYQNEHKGKVPGTSALRIVEPAGKIAVMETSPLDQKRAELKAAIDEQNFERAAELRDEIREMEKGETNNG